MSILGTRVLRTEDPGFLSTGAIYTEDVQDERLAGACYVHFVRSTVAHAKINSIDASAAKEADGVVAVYTAADLAADGMKPLKPAVPNMNQAMLQSLLASDTVRFVGEPVAAVVTEEMYQGEDAIELVDVDYGFLPAVVDMNDALSGEKGLLFPEAGTNVVCTFGDASAADPHLFDGCEVVTSEVVQNRRVAPAPMESRSAAAAWGEDGRLTAWIPNQGAQGTKGALVGALGVAPDVVRIITPDVGGGFGAKFGVDAEQVVTCWIAKQLGRPARWSETRMENLVGMTHGRAQQHKITIGGMKDGTVLAYRLEILQDGGAYPKFGPFLPSLTILMAPGPYRIPRAEAWATSVATNTTPVGAYRGAGRPEAAAAIDRAMDLFADAAGRRPGRGAAQEPAAQVHRAAQDRLRRRLRLGRLRHRAGEGPGRGGLSGTAAPSRPRAAPAATRCSSASASPRTWRSPGRAARLAVRTRTAPSRCTPTGPPPCSLAPRRTGRGTRRSGR